MLIVWVAAETSVTGIARPEDELSIGQEVEAKVVELDWENKKIGLSIRALLPVEEKAAEVAETVEAPAEDAEPTEYKEEVSNTIGDAVEVKADEE